MRSFLYHLTQSDPILDQTILYVAQNNLQLIRKTFIPLDLNITNSHHYLVSFGLYHSRLLKSPYKTQCSNYPRGITRNECRHECLKRFVRQKSGGILISYNIFPNESNYTLWIDEDSPYISGTIIRGLSICDDLCVKR